MKEELTISMQSALNEDFLRLELEKHEFIINPFKYDVGGVNSHEQLLLPGAISFDGL